jgi:hypothetical protein
LWRAEAGRFEIQVFCKFTNTCEFQAESVPILAGSESRTKFGPLNPAGECHFISRHFIDFASLILNPDAKEGK